MLSLGSPRRWFGYLSYQVFGFASSVPSGKTSGSGNWQRRQDLNLIEKDSGAIFASSAFVRLYGNAKNIGLEGNRRLHVTAAGDRSVSPVISIAVSH
jgi:hypothetical protein